MSEYIVTCDEETALWIGNDVDSMRRIVRCRDCKWFSRAMLNCARFRHGDGVYSKVEPDGFCAWGERRES